MVTTNFIHTPLQRVPGIDTLDYLVDQLIDPIMLEDSIMFIL